MRAVIHNPCESPGRGAALLVVDVQRDFLPGGSLAVPAGDEVVPVLNRWMGLFAGLGLPVVATRDWHPADHCSFAVHGGVWPIHCVAESPGAEFAPGLRLPAQAILIAKDVTPECDSYSGFQATDLEQRLKGLGVTRLFVGGLATDYCVLNTVLDALGLGFRVCLLQEAVRAVDVRPGDGDRAIRRMREAGARMLRGGQAAAA